VINRIQVRQVSRGLGRGAVILRMAMSVGGYRAVVLADGNRSATGPVPAEPADSYRELAIPPMRLLETQKRPEALILLGFPA
jgi:hypothetical protein